MFEHSTREPIVGAGSIEEAILGALADDRLDVRAEAVNHASRFVDPDELMRFVADHDDAVRRNGAIEALQLAGPRSAPALIRALEHPDPEVAMFAAGILGKMRDPCVVTHLVKMLDHDDINVVQAAIDSLAMLRAQDAVDPLIAVLDRDPWLRFAAIRALGRIGHPRAVRALLPLIEEEGIGEAVVDALGDIGSAEAIDRLAAVLRKSTDFDAFVACLRAVGRALQRQPNEDQLRRLPSWSALAGEGGAGVQRALRKVLSQGGAERESKEAATAVVRALRIRGLYDALVKATGDPGLWDVALFSALCIGGDLEPALAAALPSSDAYVKRFACVCAGILRLRALVPHLTPMLTDPQPVIRAAAIEALARINHTPALSAIARALGDESDDVHVAAVVALSRMDAAAVTRALRADVPPTKRAIRGALDVMVANPHPDQRMLVEACVADDEPSVRRAAVMALSAQVMPEATEDLAPMLKDPAPEVRREVLHALARSRHPRARDLLVAHLAADPETRADSACALAELGDPGATPALLQHFPGASAIVRLAILDALAELAEPSAEPLFVRLLADADPEMRRSAVLALGRLGTRTAFTYLASAASDASWEVRAAVAETVRIEPRTGTSAVLEQLCLDPHSAVAGRARRRLEELEGG
jgi:HEAT repeat protein